MPERRMDLTLGPLLFLWEEAAFRDFYFRIADEAEVETVVLGEVVCSKRDHFHQASLPAVTERLQRGGKQVRLASLALVTLERELKSVRRLAAQGELAVEAGEMAAVAALRGQPHAIGPLVNVYNAATARLFAGWGATSICLPPELPQEAIGAIVGGAPEVDFEVFAFGRVPLAISARCAHARAKGNSKDNCQFVCGEDPDGLVVETLDGQDFLALNGVQTMSSTCMSLIADVPALARTGIASLRLSPQVCDMVAVAAAFRAVADGRLDPAEGEARLAQAYPEAAFANGFFHGLPGHELRRPIRRRCIGAGPVAPVTPCTSLL